MRLAEKVVLITGGAAGIGRATALRLAGEGAAVCIADADAAAGLDAVAEIETAGSSAAFVHCDVTREADVQAVIEVVRARFGTLDVLINSAGILQGAFQQVEELDLETFRRVLDVNVTGTFLFCKYAIPLMPRGGVVLCLSSGGGVRGPSSSLAYGASKAGVHGLGLTLQGQMEARGIRVNIVCPGAIDTPMKRQNIRDAAAARGEDPEQVLASTKLGDPDGVARVLTFLASDEADYVTGTIFTR
jgi:NAD(P)-dependent dehydrogenase (short-subunit alcohol dehydrogenase family)